MLSEDIVQELTSRQKEVLDFVCRFRDEHGCPPSLREISEQIGTKGTATAKLHLEALERKGYISRRREGSRGIALKHAGGTPVPVPLVGTVRAGQPETAVEEIQGYISVDPAWLKGEGNFLLRVKGDSMVEAGIFDGDLAYSHLVDSFLMTIRRRRRNYIISNQTHRWKYESNRLDYRKNGSNQITSIKPDLES